MHAQSASLYKYIIGCGFDGCGLGVVSYDLGVASVLELVFKELEPMIAAVA